MSEKPILFSGEMVRAILAGRKSQTRRIVKPQPVDRDEITDAYGGWMVGRLRDSENAFRPIKCGYEVGIKLWVRETFATGYGGIFYRADYGERVKTISGAIVPWKPSIFMPRNTSRITLEIVSVRVERLQDISDDDALAEGVEPYTPHVMLPSAAYRTLWESINGKGSWAANPWVWIIEFKPVPTAGDGAFPLRH